MKLVIATSWVISDQTNIFHVVTRFCTYVVWERISLDVICSDAAVSFIQGLYTRGFSTVRD